MRIVTQFYCHLVAASIIDRCRPCRSSNSDVIEARAAGAVGHPFLNRVPRPDNRQRAESGENPVFPSAMHFVY